MQAPATPTVVTLELPFPSRALSPNYRAKHWSEKADAIASYKRTVATKAAQERNRWPRDTFPLAVPVTAVVTFVLPDRNRRDLDNLLASFKSGLDGIVASGLLHDDGCWELRIAMEAILGEHAGVRVRLEGAS